MASFNQVPHLKFGNNPHNQNHTSFIMIEKKFYEQNSTPKKKATLTQLISVTANNVIKHFVHFYKQHQQRNV
jgi:hypothetical protein